MLPDAVMPPLLVVRADEVINEATCVGCRTCWLASFLAGFRMGGENRGKIGFLNSASPDAYTPMLTAFRQLCTKPATRRSQHHTRTSLGGRTLRAAA